MKFVETKLKILLVTNGYATVNIGNFFLHLRASHVEPHVHSVLRSVHISTNPTKILMSNAYCK